MPDISTSPQRDSRTNRGRTSATGRTHTTRKTDLEERRARLLRLRYELSHLGAQVRVQRPRNGHWKLKLRHARWTETVLCAGADETYAYVTAEGRLLGPTDDVRYIARVLIWMVEGRHR
ncbi:hypothetical protein SMC26_24085 [Actinomadura fulvescens]|uniref:Uncharacterized protein n=1 Tax=Actinomadura fulvescens TaxID=46160 RepID=A0ABP6CI74_9ACTN